MPTTFPNPDCKRTHKPSMLVGKPPTPPPTPPHPNPCLSENLNGDALRLVELFCSVCARNTGTTLAFPLSVAGGFAGGGGGVSFSLPLSETAGWVKDPENTLKTAYAPTKCEMAQVLSNLSELRILGGKTYANWKARYQ